MPNSLGYFIPTDGLFKGSSRYAELQKQGKIKPGQLIRVYNNQVIAPDEMYLTADSSGRLWGDDGKTHEPRKALNSEDGWCFEGFSSDRLPEGELAKLVQ